MKKTDWLILKYYPIKSLNSLLDLGMNGNLKIQYVLKSTLLCYAIDVCVRERKMEREREKDGKREGEKEMVRERERKRESEKRDG